jgi:hypothetical protein
MSRNERHTKTLLGSFLPGPATILCHQQAFKTGVYCQWGQDIVDKIVVLEMMGRSDEGTARLLAEFIVIDQCSVWVS